MGYKSPIHPLDLPDFKGENFEDDLVVKVVAPSARESADLNAGRRTIAEKDGAEREETSAEFMRRAMIYLVPKIRFWNLEDENGEPVSLPRDLTFVPDAEKSAQANADARLEQMVDHLLDQDENIVLAIYHEWRMVGMPKRADTDEGKDSAPPSMSGRVEPAMSGEWPTDLDIRELEASIPM